MSAIEIDGKFAEWLEWVEDCRRRRDVPGRNKADRLLIFIGRPCYRVTGSG
jgi:hypothetical protein